MTTKDWELQHYKTFHQVLCEFPGVAPRLAKKSLEGEIEKGMPVRIGDSVLTEADVQEISIEVLGYYGPVVRVSPVGAAILMNLYQQGCLKMKCGQNIQEPSAEILRYIKKGRSYAQCCLEDRLKQERLEYWKRHVDEIPESDFDVELLQALFGFHGSMKMIIGGIEVHKQVCRYSSNSGKNSDYEVNYTWGGQNGEKCLSATNSHYKGNRKSDPDRNWGLGKE